MSKSVCVHCFDQVAKRAYPFFKVQKDSDFQILLFLHYLHIDYIGILICISTFRNNVRNKDNQKLRN